MIYCIKNTAYWKKIKIPILCKSLKLFLLKVGIVKMTTAALVMTAIMIISSMIDAHMPILSTRCGMGL